jgi:hypothetical protein
VKSEENRLSSLLGLGNDCGAIASIYVRNFSIKNKKSIPKKNESWNGFRI